MSNTPATTDPSVDAFAAAVATDATVPAPTTEPALSDAPVVSEPPAAVEATPLAAAPAVAAAAPAAARPAPVKPGKFDQIQAQMETVASMVLDAGELAGRSAQASLNLGAELKTACTDLEKITQNGHKKLQWLLIGAASAMILALFFFMVMGVRMVSRINQLDAMVIEVGKKVIELNTGLASLDTVNTTLTEMAQRQEALRQASTEIEGRIEASLKQSEAMVQKVPEQTAQQVAATSENLVKQVQGINGRLQTQANAVQSLAKDVQALKGSVGNVDKLNRDVQALVTLQRERYLEALQKNQATAAAAAAAAAARETAPAARERPVQYPRVPAAGAGAAAPTGAAGPASPAGPAPAASSGVPAVAPPRSP
jgi:hypothetical protein